MSRILNKKKHAFHSALCLLMLRKKPLKKQFKRLKVTTLPSTEAMDYHDEQQSNGLRIRGLQAGYEASHPVISGLELTLEP